MNTSQSKSFAIVLVFALSFIYSSFAFAGACGEGVAKNIGINKFTYYVPKFGGTNGSCGNSASGSDACEHLLSKDLKPQNSWVISAVSTNGGYDYLFNRQKESLMGGRYGANLPGVECFELRVRDRYGPSGDNIFKMDVAVEHDSVKNKRAINTKAEETFNGRSGALTPLGREPGLPSSVQKIERKDGAEEPPAPDSSGRCKVVKKCKNSSGAMGTGSACDAMPARRVCFEKDSKCSSIAASCVDAI